MKLQGLGLQMDGKIRVRRNLLLCKAGECSLSLLQLVGLVLLLVLLLRMRLVLRPLRLSLGECLGLDWHGRLRLRGRRLLLLLRRRLWLSQVCLGLLQTLCLCLWL